ncbi:MAG: hypothetical protein HC919_07390 [Oscillatoriales cyanobacterium SM2_2_1]|nr:hypothetical protein [Oscillatoriales cyanobacterium SM2_2_1]
MTNTSTNIAGSGLPLADGLDVGCLSRLFDNTATSYKYLFFLSLLDILSHNSFDSCQEILLESILVEMLATSWYSHCLFKLSFGVQDQIARELDKLNLGINRQGHRRGFLNMARLKVMITNQDIDNSLLNYVPYRIIRPFFTNELRDIGDGRINEVIIQLANEKFNTRKPLFKFTDNDSVQVHPEWADYFKINYAIIRGWASWEWLRYMQRRNSSVPAISNKLFPPNTRDSLGLQKQYWKSILINRQLKCIYCGQPLDANNFSLDHFLPWTFVTHDLLWNLIPTTNSVNSSKSDNLPALDYFNSFVEIQHIGLSVSKEVLPLSWAKHIESHISDLRITQDDLLDIDSLKQSYEAVILPQINLAISNGFTPNWRFNH